MSSPDAVKQAWLASAAHPLMPDLEAVRAGADRFHRRVRWRNGTEYAACALVVLCFSVLAALLPVTAMRIGAVMIVLGTLLVAWQLHRVASSAPPLERAGAVPVLLHQRAQLARQRDALASVFTWYLLPVIPGFVVLLLGPALQQGVSGLAHAPLKIWIVLIVAAAVFAGIWLLNRHGAARLQKMIDDIDAMTGRTG